MLGAGSARQAGVNTCAGARHRSEATHCGCRLAAAGGHAREAKKMQVGAAAARHKCYLRGRPKRCSGGQQRGPKVCSGGQQRACRLVPAGRHEYLRGRPKRCSGGQQRACRLVPASEHEYLRGRPKRCSGGQQFGCRLVPASAHEYLRGRPKRCSGGLQFGCRLVPAGCSTAADWCEQAGINTCAGGQKDAAADSGVAADDWCPGKRA